MKLYLLVFFLLFNVFFPKDTFADFTVGNYTQIITTTAKSFLKPHGQGNILYVYEDYYFNPFAGTVIKTIVQSCTWNACWNYRSGVTITINNITFNNLNPYYKSAGYEWQPWTTDAKGIKTRIVLLDNTYTGAGVNQNVKVRKYYQIPYNYDTTAPVSEGVYLYNDANLTLPFTYTTGWINTNVYYTIMCSDPETGCACTGTDVGSTCKNTSITVPTGAGTVIKTGVFTPSEWLGHNIWPKANFTNTVALRNTNIPWTLNASATNSLQNPIHYDRLTPGIDITYTSGENFNLTDHKKIQYRHLAGKLMNGIVVPWKTFFDGLKKIDKKASANSIVVSLVDPYDALTSQGVSGIKNYTINITTTTWSGVYSKSKTFAPYNSDATVVVSDSKTITLTDSNVLQKTGNYILTVYTTDFASNETQATVKFSVYPAAFSLTTSTVTLDTAFASNSTLFADNSGQYRYVIKLLDIFENPIYGKEPKSINQDCTGKNGCKTVKTDMVTTGAWVDALAESGYTGVATDASGQISIKLLSNSPGVFSERFNLIMPLWDDSYNNIAGQTTSSFVDNSYFNSFRKPFVGAMQASGDDGLTWVGLPTVGTMFKYKLYPRQKSSISLGTIASYGYNIETFAPAVKGNSAGQVAEGTVVDTSTLTNTAGSTFSSRINALTAAAAIGACSIKVDLPVISYNLWGRAIRYFLTKNDEADDMTPPSIGGSTFLWVKIIGAAQLAGKWSITGQKDNFSDISLSSMRTLIRKNAYTQITNMTSGQTIWGIKYVTGDVTLTGDQTFETLVVKNGNVILSGDLNPSNKKLLIVVIKDNYDVNNDFSKKGNIYIKPNVRKINAFLYADGWLISADNTGNPYTKDSATRTDILKNQLIMNGSLFTRNTVWGAIVAGSNYILPGGSKISDFNNAMIYDLNYTRRNNVGCDKNENSSCTDIGEYVEPFIIIYDARLQTDPPKLLTN